MKETLRYSVPAGRHRVEQSIERSRFICTLSRVGTRDEAQALVRELNSEFPDATHNCWAFVAGPPGSSNAVGMSDAGEPHGTAGRPMLTVLLHSGVGEVAAVVTRYYGGRKLGTGGLGRAYGGTVQLALATLSLVECVDYADVTVRIDYAGITIVQQAMAAIGAKVVTEDFGVEVRYTLRVPRGSVPQLRATVADATRGAGEFRVTEDGSV